MKATELRDWRAQDAQKLHQELLKLRREQFDLRMQRGAGQLGSPARFGSIRKDIARIKTVLNEKARAKV